MVHYDKLKEFLESTVGMSYFNASKTELITKCPWCEVTKSKSRREHGHCYIKVVKVNDEMPVFNCFKCGEDSTLGRGTLLKLIKFLKGDPKEFITEETLNNSSKTINYNDKKVRNAGAFVLPKVNIDNYKNKLLYLQSRLGITSEFDDINIEGLVLNIKDFIIENEIKLNKMDLEKIDFYDENFIGFVTTRGTILIIRNIDSSSSFRYHKINLTENDNNMFKDFYGYKTGEIVSGTNNILLCEGIFDLLLPLYSSEMQNILPKHFYSAAILGSQYSDSLISVLHYCKLTKCNLTILSDADKQQYYYYKLLDNPFISNLDVYWNKLGNDFGKNPISPTKIKIEKNKKFVKGEKYNGKFK